MSASVSAATGAPPRSISSCIGDRSLQRASSAPLVLGFEQVPPEQWPGGGQAQSTAHRLGRVGGVCLAQRDLGKTMCRVDDHSLNGGHQ
jgi:hypothetical protein